MGVTGLWRLIEPAGKPVPVETLENKVLAVDISIWLHQMVKGYQDAKGAPLPNAHLMGLFQRLCKLLYFRIKPVFVFDGAFPELKKETIAKRQDHKAKYNSESERIKRELALLLSKRTVVSTLLGKQISPSKQQSSTSGNNDDLFKLPALPQTEEESESESEDERSSSSIDLHTVDLESDNFKQLPVKEKYDILIDLKETRKQNSWGRLQELPKKSDNFSDFQMQRLLKRRKVQECIQETEKEMGNGGMSLNDIEFLLNEEGIDTKINTIPAKRIASNPTSKFILIKDVKQALADALKREEGNKPGPSPKAASEKSENEDKPKVVDELEEDLQKAIQMSLECSDEQSTDNNATKADDSWTSCMTDTDSEASGTDSEEEDGFEQPDIFCAKAYIMQYSDFTHSAINEIVTEKRKNKDKHKIPKVDQIIDEINKEKSVIVDNVEISSSSDESVSEVHESNINNQADIKSMPLQNNHEDLDDSLNATQKSVICVENPVPVIDIVSLNNSTEESDISIDKKPEDIKKEIDLSDEDFKEAANSTQETDSSDSDFEEVPDVESKATKPVVELTLNVDEVPDDDIFADVFSDKKDLISKDKLQEEHSTFDDVFTVKKDFISKDTLQKDQNDLNDSSIKTDSIFKAPQPIMTKVHIENKEISKVVATKEPEDVEMKEMNTAISINKEDNSKAVSTEIEINSKQVTKLSGNSISTNINKGEMLEPKENNAPKENDVPKKILTTENLNTMAEEMDDQQQVLLQEKARLDRVGRNITEQMTKEAQELLQIFGIPYLVAPMEAEAQCAFLESVKLTDGTITDDSDIWLFGGRTVYKNFFNQKKHVLQFQAERIETSFNLCREQLVLLALLVGSDYTTGVAGVGPVTAMEILASFPFSKRQLLSETTKQERYGQIIKGLQEFKQWVKAGKRTDNTSLKKKLKNVTLTEDFPSVRIVQAYLDPNVEKSDDKFAWGELDITILRDYTKAKFGWSQNKLDEIIKPVLKRVVERKTQRSMQDFFKRKIDFQSLEHQMSKRVKAAVQRMGPENKELGEIEVENNDTSEKSKPAAKRKAPSSSRSKAGPSAPKQKKDNIDNILLKQGVKVVSVANEDGNSEINIKIQKTDRFQEVIPQREKDKKSLLENKLKAIELFRKTKLDRKKKTTKRRPLKPKDKAELSESDTD